MRTKVTVLILISIITLSKTFSQDAGTLESQPIYYEKNPNGTTRFFFDDHYYLAEKDCQFKAIERLAHYDFQQQRFIGEFTDLDNLGRTILKGNYQEGKKEGEFTAYHLNGQIKWEVTFVQDRPQGLWRYYYPDGKPLLEVMHEAGTAQIHNFWDQRGKQRVTEGVGRYEFSVDADGYNEFGYIRYKRKGRVSNGRPHGNWAITYLFADGKKSNAGYEVYHRGNFILGYESLKEEEFGDAPRYGLIPADFFYRAEVMIAKTCSIDEYSGFSVFLSNHLEEWFSGQLDEMPDPVTIEFTISVSKNGVPGKIEMQKTFNRKGYADLLLEGINWITFWYPSFGEGEYIDDKLKVSVEAFPDAAQRKLRFFELTIQRERGI